jgi:hypothetical protein
MKDKEFEVELNEPYASGWDNVELPIFELSDGSYLCIAYSQNHNIYSIDTYTKEEFIEQGFERSDWANCYFEDMKREHFGY